MVDKFIEVPSNLEDVTILKRFLNELVDKLNGNALVSYPISYPTGYTGPVPYSYSTLVGQYTNTILEAAERADTISSDAKNYITGNLTTNVLQNTEDLATITEQFGTFYDDATAAAWYGLTIKSGELISGFTVSGVDSDTTTPGIAGSVFAISADTFTVGRAIEDINDPAELAYIAANGLPYGTMYDAVNDEIIPAFMIDWNGTDYDIFFNGKTEFSNYLSPGTTTINGGSITADTITASQITASTITASEIAADTITAAKIAAGTITAAKIAANTITADKIAASTITGDKVAANTIDASSLKVNTAWVSGIVKSSDFTTIGGVGFRLKAEAASTNADPDIYGAYIRGGTIDGTTINASTINIRNLNILNDAGYNISPIFSSTFSYDYNSASPYTITYSSDIYSYDSTNISSFRTIGTTGTDISLAMDSGINSPEAGFTAVFSSSYALLPQVVIRLGVTLVAYKNSGWALNTLYTLAGFGFKYISSGGKYYLCFRNNNTNINLSNTSSTANLIITMASGQGNMTYSFQSPTALVSNL